jgi:glucosamine-6-phosphate deaminase
MQIKLCSDAKELARQAGEDGAALIRQAIAARGEANIIVGTGASQFHVLAALVSAEGIDWPKVTAFHLDDYIGLPVTHPASFHKYLQERLLDRVPMGVLHFLNGNADPSAECRRVGELLCRHPIDVAFIGIGENGHLAFNDPPADFQTEEPYLLVSLDEPCRRQQVGEGWFPSLDAVPRRAISMSIRQILKSHALVCAVPDARKSLAVQAAVEGPVTPHVPASILQQHARCTLYLDPASSAALAR